MESGELVKKVRVIIIFICLFIVAFLMGYFSSNDIEEVDIYLEGEKYSFRDSEGYRQTAILKDNVVYLPLNEDSLFLDYSVEKKDDSIILTEKHYPDYVDINTRTLDGHIFTNENLFDYELTIFFNWTDWCPDCKAFLGSFSEYQSKLEEENIQFVGLPIYNGEPNLEKINKIMLDNGVDFDNLIVTADMKEQLQSNIENIPSVVIVDNKGKIVYDNEGLNLLFETVFEDIENLDLCGEC